MKQLKIAKKITDRSEESTERYLQEVSQHALISAEEEVTLAQIIRAWGADAVIAQAKLVKANLRFVVSVAKQYQNLWLTLGDLISEWNIGLVKAAWRFDETRGFKFISYAVWWIRQTILAALNDYWSIVRLPSNRATEKRMLEKIQDMFVQEHEREPTDVELAEIGNVPIEDISLINSSRKHLSLDAPLDGDEWWEITFWDMMSSYEKSGYDTMVSDDVQKAIIEVLSQLSPRERDAIAVYYTLSESTKKALHITLSSTSDFYEKYKLTESQTRNIKDRVLFKLSRKSKKTNSIFGEVADGRKVVYRTKRQWTYAEKHDQKEKSRLPKVKMESAASLLEEYMKTQNSSSNAMVPQRGKTPQQETTHHHREHTETPVAETMLILWSEWSIPQPHEREIIKTLMCNTMHVEKILHDNKGDRAISELVPVLSSFLTHTTGTHEWLYDLFHSYLRYGEHAMIIWHTQLQGFLKKILNEALAMAV